MVRRYGRKPSGEQVSISLSYALGLRTDQTLSEHSFIGRGGIFLRNEHFKKHMLGTQKGFHVAIHST
jgi:hypothetical protein